MVLQRALNFQERGFESNHNAYIGNLILKLIYYKYNKKRTLTYYKSYIILQQKQYDERELYARILSRGESIELQELYRKDKRKKDKMTTYIEILKTKLMHALMAPIRSKE